jgi:hypothetical protein
VIVLIETNNESDKGFVVILGFGVPPLAHEDDPIRAIETALDIHALLQKVYLSKSVNLLGKDAMFNGSNYWKSFLWRCWQYPKEV